MQQHINKVDIPAVWLVVLLEIFEKIPWPGIAAFAAFVYTAVRTFFLIKNRGKSE